MLSDAALIAFIATAKPDEARAFYADDLGLTLLSDEPHALVFDCRGTMLRIQKADALTPVPSTALGWHTKDIAALARRLLERGVRGERYPYLEQDELGIWHTPGGAQVFWFKDPDGNTLSLTEF
ncbi:MAG: hypothetical protein JWN48_4751 [Myxococcaceae bacterium]|nr:hypothetical protein [Myxococcaceae bacterium]